MCDILCMFGKELCLIQIKHYSLPNIQVFNFLVLIVQSIASIKMEQGKFLAKNNSFHELLKVRLVSMKFS